MKTRTPQGDIKTDAIIHRFIGNQRKKRAYGELARLTGIDVEKQSQRNILDIYHRLRTESGLPDNIQSTIQKEKKQKEDILTPDEFVLFQTLLTIPFIANHATSNKEIIKNKNLYSSKELLRRNISVETHTSSYYGEDDFVFFSYSLPEKKEVVNFINYPGATVIYVNLDQFMQKDPSSYSHMWTSGHFHAYDQEDSFQPTIIETKESKTLINIYNQVLIEKGLKYQRKFVFSHSNQKLEQTWTREGEIAAGRHIKPFHILRLIEFIRYLDPALRKYILKKPDNRELLAQLFYSLFTPGKAELHMPVAFHMDHLDNSRESLDSLYSWKPIGLFNLSAQKKQELCEAVLKSQQDKINEAVLKDQQWKFITCDMGFRKNVSLLNLAVLHKQYSIVETLLAHGANPDSSYLNASQSDYHRKAERYAMQDALEMKDFALIKLLSGEYKKKSDFSIKLVAKIKTIDMYAAISDHLEMEIFQYLYQRFPRLDERSLGKFLMMAVLYDNVKVLSYLLGNKANPNQTYDLLSNVDKGHLMPSGMTCQNTPLTLAISLGRVNTTKILLDSKADPNLQIKDSGMVYKFGIGPSPLMIVKHTKKNPDKEWFHSYLKSNMTKSKFQNLALQEETKSSVRLTIEKLLIEAKATTTYQSIKSNKQKYFHHEVYAFITGINRENIPVILLAEKFNDDHPYLVIPGGPINYEIDKDHRSAIIRWTHSLVHVDLEEAKFQKKIRFQEKNTLIEVSHYQLPGLIDTKNFPRNTYNSKYMEWKAGQGQLGFDNIQWVPLRHIKNEIVEFQSIRYPLYTFQGKALPCIVTSFLMKLFEMIHLHSEELLQLIFSMHDDPGKLMMSQIKDNNIENVMTLLKLKIKLQHSDYFQLIKKALSLKHYHIVEALMTSPYVIDAEDFHHFFNLDMVDKNHSLIVHPEKLVMTLFSRCISNNCKKNFLPSIAKYSGHAGFFKMLEVVFKFDKSLVQDASEGALISRNLPALKWILHKTSGKEKSDIIKKLLVNNSTLEIEMFLVDEYKGEIPASGSLVSRIIDKYYDSVEQKNIVLQEQCLVFLERLIDKGYQDGYHSAISTYLELQRQALFYQAELLSKIFCKNPILALEFAEKIGSMERIDNVILTHAENSLIKKYFIKTKTFLYEEINAYFQRAIQNNSMIIVRFILENGFNHRYFDINKVDASGFTPLQNARRLKSDKIEKLLLVHGAFNNEVKIQSPTFCMSHSNSHIILYSDSPLSEAKQTKTGDVDYVNQLQWTMNALETKCDISQSIVPSKKNPTILHLMINAPHTGCAMEIERLKNLKEGGCRIVVTAIEFAKHTEIQYKLQTLAYLQYADSMIFLDEIDKHDALFFSRTRNLSLSDKIREASVIPMLPTIPVQYVTKDKKASNIMCFGMIRKGKGFAHVMRLAQLIKESKDPLVNKKKIYIVGSIQKHRTRKIGTEFDSELYQILCKLYPQHQHQFYQKTPTELFMLYHQIKSKPALPIHLFMDVEEKDLAALFQQCEYAFYPAYRGATLRNSSIATELAFGCIIYSHISEITPDCLLKDGEYHQSMVLFEDYSYDTYPKSVLADIAFREYNKIMTNIYDGSIKLNDKTRQIANHLLETTLSAEQIVNKHLEVYESLSKPTLKRTKAHAWFLLFKRKSEDASGEINITLRPK